MKKITIIIITFFATFSTNGQLVSTLAGSSSGFLNGTGTGARFDGPYGVCTDSGGNIYVGDLVNNKIRKITPAGVVTTFAGSSQGFADGTGTAARFDYPCGLACDASDNIYVADSFNFKIRKITPAGVVTTLAGSTIGFADGTGSAAKFNNPVGVAVDAAGNVYVADDDDHRIRKITPSGVVTTLAGGVSGFADGNGSSAKFNNPNDVEVDVAGNVYVADYANHKIRKITPSGNVTTFAGSTIGYVDASGTSAKFSGPSGIEIDGLGNIYVSDYGNSKIRKITASGMVSTFAGSSPGYSDGAALSSQFNGVYGLTHDSTNSIYVADFINNKIRKVTQALSIQDFNKIEVSLYPNPVQNSFTIKGEIEVKNLIIYNLFGQKVKAFNESENHYAIAELSSGIYIVELSTENGSATTKLIKE